MDESCVFCKIKRGELPGDVIYQDELCFVLLDKFPLSPRHVLVVASDHQEFVSALPAQQIEHLWRMGQWVRQALAANYENILGAHFLLNDGAHTGQHIPHVHLHIIPRYRHDGIARLFSFLTRFINPKNYMSGSQKTKIARTLAQYQTVVKPPSC